MAEVSIPSFGMFGLLSAGAYTWALVEAFRQGQSQGWTIVGLGIVLFPIAIAVGFKVLPRTPMGRRLFLRAPSSEQVQRTSAQSHLRELEGKRGLALTDLRPSGLAQIDGQRIDVVAGGCYIMKGERVQVRSVQGHRVEVQQEGESET